CASGDDGYYLSMDYW
nr:immunoglobulin heavy chain junction region [Mus musculus]